MAKAQTKLNGSMLRIELPIPVLDHWKLIETLCSPEQKADIGADMRLDCTPEWSHGGGGRKERNWTTLY